MWTPRGRPGCRKRSEALAEKADAEPIEFRIGFAYCSAALHFHHRSLHTQPAKYDERKSKMSWTVFEPDPFTSADELLEKYAARKSNMS